MGYASGPSVYGQVIPSSLNADSLKQKAVEMASKADIVLFFGGLNKNHHQDCEGGDRLDYGLPFGQPDLISSIYEVNPNIGMFLISGNAVEMPWLKKVKGLMQAWYLGSESGHALADLISGDVNPSGKLPFSFPKKLEDNGAHYYGEISYPGDSINTEYKEDILVGYRWHDTKKITPQFAFGHGLSYTNFEFSNFSIDGKDFENHDKINLKLTIRNTGNRAGAEVVQIYVGKSKSKVPRAVKELRAFKKVKLNPGDQTRLNLEILVKDLAYYEESVSDWIVEPGDYIIYIGNASDQIYKKFKITVD